MKEGRGVSKGETLYNATYSPFNKTLPKSDNALDFGKVL